MNFFQKQNTRVKESQQSQLLDPMIYSDPDPEFYIITDSYGKNQVPIFKKLFSKIAGREVAFSLIYSFIIKTKEPDLKKGIKNHVIKYGTKFKDYIPPQSKILSVGRGLFSITEETSLNVQGFYALGFVEQKFYYPEVKSWVFPVDHLTAFYSLEQRRPYDKWEFFFFKMQVKALLEYKVPALRTPLLKRIVVEDPNQFLRDHMNEERLAWDLETTGLSFFKDDIICMTMSFDGRTGYYLDWKSIDKELLDEFLKDKFQIGANLKFDCKFLRHRGIKNANIDFDTLHAGHILNEMRSNSLSTHGWVYTYYGGHERELQRYLLKHPRTRNYGDIPKEILSEYAINDAIICFQVYEAMVSYLKMDPKLNSYYYNEVVPNLKMFLEIELEGVFIDWDKIKEIADDFRKEQLDLEKKIHELAGEEFNVKSKKELGLLFENKLHMPDLGAKAKDSIGGYYLSGESQLQDWAKMGYEIADYVIKHREVTAFIDTFLGDEKLGNAYWAYRHEDRVHPIYKVMLAQSHRNKCDSPNLQQVPAKSKRANIYRQIFIPPTKDYFISEGDYSGFQMRIAAVLSGDENLKKAFLEYGDPHSMTTVGIFHPHWQVEDFLKVKNESPYKEQRAIGKSSNFAFLFGGGSYSFTQDVIMKSWTYDQCIEFLEEKRITWKDDPFFAVGEEIRNSFFRTYPRLKKWHEKCHRTAEEEGCIYSVYGARRLLPELTYIGEDSDSRELSKLYNKSKNSPVQNFEAVAIMRAMRELHSFYKENGMKSRLFGMIHDATQNYIHRDEQTILKKKIPEIFERDYPEYEGMKMEYEMDLADPYDVDNPLVWGFGINWN